MPSTSETNPRHAILVELGLASPLNKNANGKRNRNGKSQQQQKRSSIGSLDVLQKLLETNIVSFEQLRAAHASLKEERGEKEEDVEKKSVDNKEDEKQPPLPDYRTRHIALRVYYEGKEYSGLAENVGQDGDRSVERHLFAALQKTRLIQSRQTCGYSRCGRTDKGVSAVGQVIALQLKSAISLEASWDETGQQIVTSDDEGKLPKNAQDCISVWVPPRQKKKKSNNNTPQSNDGTNNKTAPATRQQKDLSEYAYDKILNSILPDDIRVLGWCPVSKDFSARFSAATRTYRYFFSRRNLNLEAMKQGLQLLVGSHDFRNLCKLNVIEVSNFVRTIHAAELISSVSLFGGDQTSSKQTSVVKAQATDDGICYFQIQGQAFLWHQIRCIVSVLFMIGRGLEEPSVITELLSIEKMPGKPSYPLASEFPLVLHGCGYPNLELGYFVQNLWTVTCQLETQWETLVLEAARVRNCLNMLRGVPTVRKSELVDFCKKRLMDRHKKEQRNNSTNKNNQKKDDRRDRWETYLKTIESEESGTKSETISWDDALAWLGRFEMVADGNALRDHIHIPLLQRSKGTTLEEKVEALQQSSTRRSQRYEENVAKKQKSQGEDAAFYEHMLKQGSN